MYLETYRAKYVNKSKVSSFETLDLPEAAKKKDGPHTTEYNEDLLPASTTSPDFIFVQNFKNNQTKMNWNACFNSGRAKDNEQVVNKI